MTESSFGRRIAPAVGLFFLAPWVAEFLLGDMSIAVLPVLLAMAPLYGGGALLIREITRRAGRGWPTLILLALAYALIEEGLVIQTLFNPNYSGFHLLKRAWIPGLGIGGWWTLFVLTLHTIWSMASSIAVAEALSRDRRTTPWLGKVGLGVTSGFYLLGCAMIFAGTYRSGHFLAAPAQLIGVAALAALAVVAAFRFPRPAVTTESAPVPGLWAVAAFAFVATGVFMALGHSEALSGWATVAIYLTDYALAIGLIARWARRSSWSAAHGTALAGGALMTYAWVGFVMKPILGAPGTVDIIGNAVFAALAAGLSLAAVRASSDGARRLY